MSDLENEETFTGWGRLELLGHRQSVGWVETVRLAGATVFKVSRPGIPMETPDQPEFYGVGSLYCLTGLTEAEVRSYFARRATRYELAEPRPPREYFDGEAQEVYEEEDAALFEGGRLSPVDVAAKLTLLGLPTSFQEVQEWSSTQRLEVDIWAQLEWRHKAAPGLVDRVPAPEVVRERSRQHGLDVSAESQDASEEPLAEETAGLDAVPF